jgi:ribonuclease VapC
VLRPELFVPATGTRWRLGLSLGGRCCLALGARLALPTVTADTAWAGLGLDEITVQVIR